MSSVVVTGGSGFIGRHLVSSLVAKGWRVANVDIDDKLHPVDIRSSRMLRAVFRRSAPEVVVHLAALASVPECERNPRLAFETNIMGTANVLSMADEFECRLIFASTAAVYGNPDALPTPETCRLDPINRYGVTKLAGEQMVRSIMGDKAVTFRVFNVYGPSCQRSYVIPDTIAKIADGLNPVPMLGTGKESRDFLYVSDLVAAITRAAESTHVSGVFNIGSGETVTIGEVIQQIAKIMERSSVSFQFEGTRRIGDFDTNWADTSKIRRELGWRPATSLSDGLKTTVDEYTRRVQLRSSS